MEGRTSQEYCMKKNKLNGPNYFTIARIIMSVVFMFFVLIPETWAKIVAFILFVLTAVTDTIDGAWARKKNIVTDFGKFLDPLADKVLVDLTFMALVYLDVVPVWVFAVIIIRDLVVDGVRMMAAKENITIAASFYGKLKTVIQMTALGILLFNLIVDIDFFNILGNIALYISLTLVVLSALDYLIKNWKKIIK